MTELNENLDQNLKLNIFNDILKTNIGIDNLHSVIEKIDNYLDTYYDYEGFYFLMNKIENDYYNIFYPLNNN